MSVRPGAGRTGVSATAVTLAVVAGAGAAVVVFADRVGLDHRTPFVQLIAFRPQLAVAVVVLAVLAAALGRVGWPVATALGLVGVLGLLAVLPRATGQADGAPPPTLDVLTVNTYLGRADPAALADLVRRRAPAVVVLPESKTELRDALAAALGRAGEGRYRTLVADQSEDESPMTVLVDRSLGRPTVTVDRETEFPSIVVTLPPGRRDLPGRQGLRVVATHPQSPKPGDTRAWRRDIAALGRWCAGGPPTVIAGDLNATWDHAELRAAAAGCTDAASSVGEGLGGTWPSTVPAALGSQIDHVLLARGPQAAAVEFVDVPGSDHRGVLARLRPASAPAS